MPEVNVRADIGKVFAEARAIVAADTPAKRKMLGGEATVLGIVAADRTIAMLAGLAPGCAPSQFEATARRAIPSNRPLNITAIGFTGLKAPRGGDLSRWPFLAALLSFTYVGHNVVVFEGHESGFEAALSGADVLPIDSGMLPFLQSDWFDVAQRVFRGQGRVRVFEVAREKTRLQAVVPSKNPPGWEYATEDDGERSYVNALLTTLARRPPIEIQIDLGRPLPDLSQLATAPDEIDWTSKLPFQYDILSVEEVIQLIRNFPGAKWSPPRNHQIAGSVRAVLAEAGGESRPVSFRFLSIGNETGIRSVRVEWVAQDLQ